MHKGSYLEYHHLWQLLHILSIKSTNILINLTPEEYARINLLLQMLILSTDLAVHKITLEKVDSRKKFLSKQIARSKKSKDFELNEEDTLILMSGLMKSADLSNEMRYFTNHF